MIIRELNNYKNIFNSKILLIHGDNVALKKEYEKKIVKLFNKNNYNSKIYYEEDFFKNKDIVLRVILGSHEPYFSMFILDTSFALFFVAIFHNFQKACKSKKYSKHCACA